jgi:hypothetical protein
VRISYQEAKVTAAKIANGLRLRRVRTNTNPVPHRQHYPGKPNGTTELQYVDLPAYIAASPDQQIFIELTPAMIEPCR